MMWLVTVSGGGSGWGSYNLEGISSLPLKVICELCSLSGPLTVIRARRWQMPQKENSIPKSSPRDGAFFLQIHSSRECNEWNYSQSTRVADDMLDGRCGAWEWRERKSVRREKSDQRVCSQNKNETEKWINVRGRGGGAFWAESLSAKGQERSHLIPGHSIELCRWQIAENDGV